MYHPCFLSLPQTPCTPTLTHRRLWSAATQHFTTILLHHNPNDTFCQNPPVLEHSTTRSVLQQPLTHLFKCTQLTLTSLVTITECMLLQTSQVYMANSLLLPSSSPPLLSPSSLPSSLPHTSRVCWKMCLHTRVLKTRSSLQTPTASVWPFTTNDKVQPQ